MVLGPDVPISDCSWSFLEYQKQWITTRRAGDDASLDIHSNIQSWCWGKSGLIHMFEVIGGLTFIQVIPFMYASEVFPLVHREAGMSLAVSVNFALAGALTMAVPIFAKTGNQFALLGSFAGLDGLAAIGVWLFMRSPERALSLEDMNVRSLPSSSIAFHQSSQSCFEMTTTDTLT
jgi:hypothetical protein